MTELLCPTSGLYLHEVADVFEAEHGNILSLKSVAQKRLHPRDGVESLALNPLFALYYESASSFQHKVSLQTLVNDSGLLYCDNGHISRVMVFSNSVHGRLQCALLTILKNDDYLHSFKFIKTKLKENYPDLFQQLDYDRTTDIAFTRSILQKFSPLIHIYRVPTINRYDDNTKDTQRRRNKNSKIQAADFKTEIVGDLWDLRYQRRYPHSMRVFNVHFNDRIYDLVRSVCMKRMIRYHEEDFVIANNGVKAHEFETIWQSMYSEEIFPFLQNDYALFHHLIEFQSHNIRALPISNIPESIDSDGSATTMEEDALSLMLMDEEDASKRYPTESPKSQRGGDRKGKYAEFSGSLIAGSSLISSARSLYDRANKMYYQSYHFVPVQPYNNQTYSRLINLKNMLHNQLLHKQKESHSTNDGNGSESLSEQQQHQHSMANVAAEKLVALKREYAQNISYLLKTFRSDGIPLCDFARIFEFRYHNIENTKQSTPLLSFNPDVIAVTIDMAKGVLNVGDLHRSLSNLLVVWGALITPKTKPIQQQIVFPLNLGVMNWTILSAMDYYNHKESASGSMYNVSWTEVKRIGQQHNNYNSVIHQHRQQTFGSAPDTKLWIMDDTEWLKHHSFFKFASNVTLSHKFLFSPQQLSAFWPNSESNLMLFRRPVAPIMDYDTLMLCTLWQSNDQFINRNRKLLNVAFFKFVDDLHIKYSRRMDSVHEKAILHDFLSTLTLRICYLLTLYIEQYDDKINYLRWSTLMNRYETLWGRLLIPSFDIQKSHNLIFGILGSLHCNMVDAINNKEFVEKYLIEKGHFKIPSHRGMNQLFIQFPVNLLSKYINPMIAPRRNIKELDVSISMNEYHKQFVPISFLLSSQMLQIKKYNNSMMSADLDPDDWKHSDSYYALSMDPLTRSTVHDIMYDRNTEGVGDGNNDGTQRRGDGSAGDLNDKFQRLLSRQVYCVATMKEVLSSLKDEQWDQLSNTLIRHIVDGFVLRGELSNAWKLLMKWFVDKLGHRHQLYAHLCSIYLNHNDLASSFTIYDHLRCRLVALHEGRESNDDYHYESQMVMYSLCECTNRFVPKIIENGQFYLFNELIDGILKLKEQRIIREVDPFVSNGNLKMVFECFNSNELVSRLLSLAAFIKMKEPESMGSFFRSTFKQKDIMSLLRLSWNHNNKLAKEMTDIIIAIDREDGAIINWQHVLDEAISQQIVHSILSNQGVVNIYDEITEQSINWHLDEGKGSHFVDPIRLSVDQCSNIVGTYCGGLPPRISLGGWRLVSQWIIDVQRQQTGDAELLETFAVQPPQNVNAMIYYFVGIECFECLLSENHGDAVKWMGIAMDTLRGYKQLVDEHIYDMNGVVVMLQIAATMGNMDLFCDILEVLSAESTNVICEHYTDLLIECFINDNVQRLSNKAKTLQFEHYDTNGAERHQRMSDLIATFEAVHRDSTDDEKRRELVKRWISSTERYQSLCMLDQYSRGEVKSNVYDSM